MDKEKLILQIMAEAEKDGEPLTRAEAEEVAEMEIKAKGIKVVIYEPTLKEETFFNSEVIKDVNEFKEKCDVIVANRFNNDLEDVLDKVYTRDLYFRD